MPKQCACTAGYGVPAQLWFGRSREPAQFQLCHNLALDSPGQKVFYFHKSRNIIFLQCCGSGIFIPDPIFFHPGSRSEFFPSRIPDPNFFHPGSASKNLSILPPETWFLTSRKYDLGPDPDVIPIPDPGVEKAPDPDPQHWLSKMRLPAVAGVRFWAARAARDRWMRVRLWGTPELQTALEGPRITQAGAMDQISR